MDVRAALNQLCQANGPSGFETQAIQCASKLLKPLVDETWIDRAGNLIGVRRCRKAHAKRVLLDAHLDEVGLIVTGIDGGFLRFQTIGGVDVRMLADREVTLLTDPPLFGVITCLPPHIQDKEAFDQTPAIEKLLIDVGLSAEQAKEQIPLGTPAVFRSDCFSLGERNFCGKALDDRAGFIALLCALERLQQEPLPVDLYVMGSTQEEVGGLGAGNGAYAICPDCCVAVDVTFGQSPDTPKEKTFQLGSGAAIGVGPNMTRWMSQRMIGLAQEEKIPYQIEVMEGSSGTNGWAMQIVREGIATMVVSLPVKNMHTPVEVLALSDLEAVSALIAAFIRSFKEETQ